MPIMQSLSLIKKPETILRYYRYGYGSDGQLDYTYWYLHQFINQTVLNIKEMADRGEYVFFVYKWKELVDRDVKGVYKNSPFLKFLNCLRRQISCPYPPQYPRNDVGYRQEFQSVEAV
jgi:hypothetical protein